MRNCCIRCASAAHEVTDDSVDDDDDASESHDQESVDSDASHLQDFADAIQKYDRRKSNGRRK